MPESELLIFGTGVNCEESDENLVHNQVGSATSTESDPIRPPPQAYVFLDPRTHHSHKLEPFLGKFLLECIDDASRDNKYNDACVYDCASCSQNIPS